MADRVVARISVFALLVALLASASLLAACAQSGDPQESGDAPASDAAASSSTAADANPARSAKGAKSILDALSGVAESITGAAEGAADAVVEAKDNAERQIDEWRKEREAEAAARAKAAVDNAKLAPKSKVLEYSKKKAAALKLVECSDSSVDVSASGKVDLSQPGTVKVVYTLSRDGQESKRTVKFKVRDKKKPQISLVDKAPSIEAGAEYDPARNVEFVKDPVDGKLSRVDSAPEARGSKAGADVFYDAGWYTVEGGVDTQTPGVYPIDVYAADIHGNTAHRSFDVTVVQPKPAEEAAPAAPAAAAMSYVLNTNTHKFHYPGCRAVGQMNASNRQDVEMSRDEIIGMGYSSCGICHP